MKNEILNNEKIIIYDDYSVFFKKNGTTRKNFLKKDFFYLESNKSLDENLYFLFNKKKENNKKYQKHYFFTLKFSPQEEAEGDHRSIYITDMSHLIIEDFNYYTSFNEKKTKEIYDLNVNDLSSLLHKKQKNKNKLNY